MKKSEQIIINDLCDMMWDNAMREFVEEFSYKNTPWERLRSCQAWTVETDNYVFLKSYETIIAVIDKSTGTLYDMLRSVYCYTSTSAQHISKFYKDYGKYEWGCKARVTYREV